MTVTLANGTYRDLQGLSTDDKPMDVEDGGTFHVIDTGEMYVFHDGVWEPDLRRVTAIKQAELAAN